MGSEIGRAGVVGGFRAGIRVGGFCIMGTYLAKFQFRGERSVVDPLVAVWRDAFCNKLRRAAEVPSETGRVGWGFRFAILIDKTSGFRRGSPFAGKSAQSSALTLKGHPLHTESACRMEVFRRRFNFATTKHKVRHCIPR